MDALTQLRGKPCRRRSVQKSPRKREPYPPQSLSLRKWAFHPFTCTHVRLLGPCFKTGRWKPPCQHQATASPGGCAPCPEPQGCPRCFRLHSSHARGKGIARVKRSRALLWTGLYVQSACAARYLPRLISSTGPSVADLAPASGSPGKLGFAGRFYLCSSHHPLPSNHHLGHPSSYRFPFNNFTHF